MVLVLPSTAWALPTGPAQVFGYPESRDIYLLHHFLGFPVRTFELSFSESSILKESKTMWCVKFFGGLGGWIFCLYCFWES